MAEILLFVPRDVIVDDSEGRRYQSLSSLPSDAQDYIREELSAEGLIEQQVSWRQINIPLLPEDLPPSA